MDTQQLSDQQGPEQPAQAQLPTNQEDQVENDDESGYFADGQTH